MSTKMGSVISVSLETSGQERTKQYATLSRAQEQEKVAQEKALAASAAASPPPPSNDYGTKKSTDRSQPSVSGPSKNKRFTPSNSTSDHYRSSKCEYPGQGMLGSRCVLLPHQRYTDQIRMIVSATTFKRNDSRRRPNHFKNYRYSSTVLTRRFRLVILLICLMILLRLRVVVVVESMMFT